MQPSSTYLRARKEHKGGGRTNVLSSWAGTSLSSCPQIMGPQIGQDLYPWLLWFSGLWIWPWPTAPVSSGLQPVIGRSWDPSASVIQEPLPSSKPPSVCLYLRPIGSVSLENRDECVREAVMAPALFLSLDTPAPPERWFFPPTRLLYLKPQSFIRIRAAILFGVWLVKVGLGTKA